MNNLPTIQDIRNTDLKTTQETDIFNALMAEEPPKDWIKIHPYIRDHKYLPIEKVEYLLKKIFKNYRIEITGQGIAFNGVYVTIRIHYLHPVLNEWSYHDGIGACQLQTAKGTSPADLVNINNGAISMAFPIAESFAIKDAADKFGTLFGANLNRKDIAPFKIDKSVSMESLIQEKEYKRIDKWINDSTSIEMLEKVQGHLEDQNQADRYIEKEKQLTKKK